jgi:16S rRNA (cytosine967-C5)-methyltransferase
MPVSPARAAAFEILLRVETTEAYASELLHSQQYKKLSSANHRLLTELVLGVLRWRSVLDATIARHSTHTREKMDLEVLTGLRLGAYQQLFLSRIPSHAAVSESVELVKRAKKRSAAGLVNAVLRKISAEESSVPNAAAAHPQWLVERWRANYGEQATEKICSYDQAPPQTIIRCADPRVIEELRTEGVAVRPASLLAKAFTVVGGDITHTKLFRERKLLIQDEASQTVALLVGKGNSILDCCAAPGGKTRILAEQNPRASVVALELHPHRAALMRRLVPERNVQIAVADARQVPIRENFERVLVDAPCTGTGTLARNPEIKWRLKPEDIARLQAYQMEILQAAICQVAPGGRLIYSTCSLEPEENEKVVEAVIKKHSSFSIRDCRGELERLDRDGELATNNVDSLLNGPYLRTTPGVHACDGFFAAVLEKQC